ncbi:hypothetical protein Nit79A3_1835 [Nitrosomonas sp. Is79A3]
MSIGYNDALNGTFENGINKTLRASKVSYLETLELISDGLKVSGSQEYI